MSSKRDYYEVLGIGKGASDAEIKSAYRSMALKWHPDKNKDPGATEHFKEINEAFEVLSNPQKRQAYDQYGHNAPRGNPFGQGGGGQSGSYSYQYGGNINDIFESMGFGGQGAGQGGFSDPFDIFESMFSGGARRQPQKPLYQIRISFDEAYFGVEKEMVFRGKSKTLKIPAGVSTGNRISFNEFNVLVEVAPSTTFQRDGQNLYYEKKISYLEAILGAETTIPTPEKEVRIKVKPGTQPNTAVRLKGFGFPHVHSKRRGDLYVVLKVEIPARLSSEEKDTLTNLKKNLRRS